MQKVKSILLVIILGFIGLFLFQNKIFFLEKQMFDVDLMIKKYHTPEIYNGVLFVGCFLTGLLISYFSVLLERFKAKKVIKTLDAQVSSYNKKITSLESELASLQKKISVDQQPANEQSAQGINESSVSS